MIKIKSQLISTLDDIKLLIKMADPEILSDSITVLNQRRQQRRHDCGLSVWHDTADGQHAQSNVLPFRPFFESQLQSSW